MTRPEPPPHVSPGPLQQEIGKRNPFPSPAEEAVLSLLKTSDGVGFQFARLFRQYGLTASQYNVLRILRGEGQPLPCLEIAHRMIQAVPAITGLIDRLEALGLVIRIRSDSDRRIIYIAITPKAQEVLTQLDEPIAALHRQLMGGLTSEEQRILSLLLAKIRTTEPPGSQTPI